MTKYAFVIDQRKCIGCHACTVACKVEHDVPIGVYRTWVKYVEKGEFPNSRRYFLVNRCNHCDDAPCVSICPTKALYKRKDVSSTLIRCAVLAVNPVCRDRKSTRLNSSHDQISYAVFCLKKKKKK